MGPGYSTVIIHHSEKIPIARIIGGVVRAPKVHMNEIKKSV